MTAREPEELGPEPFVNSGKMPSVWSGQADDFFARLQAPFTQGGEPASPPASTAYAPEALVLEIWGGLIGVIVYYWTCSD